MRKSLLESRDSWLTSADHDKRQMEASLAIGGLGLFLSGVSILGIVAGAPVEGIMGLGFGATITGIGINGARLELADYTKSTAFAAQQDLQLRELGD